MTSRYRYQSPPNWPPPPPGWTPPPGWAPDASWGPAPEGWEFWVSEEPDKTRDAAAWAWALGSAAAWYLVAVVGLVAIGAAASGVAPPPEVLGRVFAMFLFGGAALGLIAWLSRSRWPRWIFPLAVLPATFLFAAISSVGRVQQ